MDDAYVQHPGYRIDLIPLTGVGRVHAGSTLVAESERSLIVRESDHQDVLYVPEADVVAELEDLAWTYRHPHEEVAGLEGYVGFDRRDGITITANVPFDDGTEAVTTFPVWGTESDLIGLMDPAPVDDTLRYRTPIFPDPPLGTFVEDARGTRMRNVVEGGQLLGAVIAAASKARPDLRLSWASIIFAKAAHWDSPIDIELEVRRDGRSIAAFDARVVQDGVLRASASTMSDVGSADVIAHGSVPPDVPGPADCPRHDFGVIGREYRVVDGAYQRQDIAGPPVLHVWSRFSQDPGPAYLHQAAHAQSSTHWSIAAALRPYPELTEADAHITISTGPLALAIAFHDEIDVTDWLLTETRSVYAGRGSSQSQTITYAPGGRVVASSTVQAMIRPFTRPPEALGRDSTTAM